MTLQNIEKVAADKSIGDKEFFEKFLLKYLNKQNKNTDLKTRETEINHLRTLIERLRPQVMEMLRQYVLKQHEHCCKPK